MNDGQMLRRSIYVFLILSHAVPPIVYSSSMRTGMLHSGGTIIGADSVSGLSDGFTVVNCSGLEMDTYPGDEPSAYPLLRAHDMPPPSYVQVMKTAAAPSNLHKEI